MKVREAMIVAGGAGTRLWPLTRSTPKPLVEFCGAPFLEGVIRRLAAIGVDRVLLVVGADPSPFTVLEPAAKAVGVALETVPEPQPLDTAGGVVSALDKVTGPFLVLNGDILTDVDFAAAIDAHARAGADATLVLTRVADTSAFGVCVLEGTRVRGFVEKPAPGTVSDDTVNAGTYVLTPEVLADFPPGRLSFEREVFPQLVASGRHVEGFVSNAVWADLGTPERYLAGHRLALDGAMRWPSLDDVVRDAPTTRGDADRSGIARGANVEVADDAHLHAPVLLADNARVGPGATVGPYTVVGRNGRVAANARVVGSVLSAETTVAADISVTNTICGRRTHVGADLDEVVVADAARVDTSARATTVPKRTKGN